MWIVAVVVAPGVLVQGLKVVRKREELVARPGVTDLVHHHAKSIAGREEAGAKKLAGALQQRPDLLNDVPPLPSW